MHAEVKKDVQKLHDKLQEVDAAAETLNKLLFDAAQITLGWAEKAKDYDHRRTDVIEATAKAMNTIISTSTRVESGTLTLQLVLMHMKLLSE